MFSCFCVLLLLIILLYYYFVIRAFQKSASFPRLCRLASYREDLHESAWLETLGHPKPCMVLEFLCVHNLSIWEVCWFLFQEFIIFFPCLVSVCGHAASLGLSQSATLSFFSLLQQGIQSMLFPSILQVRRQKSVLQAAPQNQHTGNRFHSSLSLLREKMQTGLLNRVGLGERLIQLKYTSFSYQFQWGCSWPWAFLGYCKFLTGFWSLHKVFLDYLYLLSQCVFGKAKFKASQLPSCWCHFPFFDDF